MHWIVAVDGFHHHRSAHTTVPSPSSESTPSSRRHWIRTIVSTAAAGGGLAVSSSNAGGGGVILGVPPAFAAPPIAVIAEELGYFPVQNRNGDFVYVPKRVQRSSTPQAVELAKALRESGVTMYGAYWCPHCSRQKEVFGAQAWSLMSYVECSPKGYSYQGGKQCKGVDGYPTFRDKKGKINISGERSLESLASTIGFSNFDPSLEDEVPMPGTSCNLR
jgi:hypothetical protein